MDGQAIATAVGPIAVGVLTFVAGIRVEKSRERTELAKVAAERDRFRAELADRHSSNRQNYYAELLSLASGYLLVMENPTLYASDIDPVRLASLHELRTSMVSLASVSPSEAVADALTDLRRVYEATYRGILVTQGPHPDSATTFAFRNALRRLEDAIRADTLDTRV